MLVTRRHRSLVACAAAFTLLVASIAAAQSVGVTTTLAPLAGRLYTPASGQSNIGFYATDLGHVLKHNGSLRVLFGDTWANSSGALIGTIGDDAQGTLSITTGDGVDAYVNSHPPDAGELSWQRAAPPVTFRTNWFGLTAPQAVYRGNTLLNMTYFRAPLASFSNAKTGTASGAFALFGRKVAMQCTASACSDNLSCDTGLGACFPTAGEDALPCVIGTTRCGCQAVSGGGMCIDPTSPMYDPESEDGRVLAVAMRTEIGNANTTIHEQYAVKSWYTNKFVSPAARTVDNFDPSRANGVGNDYRPADGLTPTANEKVFLWGRPNFAGIDAQGQNLKLYFAYVDMPSYSANASFAWTPKYFTGLNGSGVPQFSTKQTLAAPLNLSGAGDPTTEVKDYVGIMSITWVGAPVNRWVMLYGGDAPPSAMELWLGPNWQQSVRDPQGAIQARFASQPWGPWSAPVPVLAGGNPAASPPGGQYGSGGILYHPSCTTDCAPAEPSLPLDDYGRLYAPYVVEPWTTARSGGADIYWNVSTWNPYQVVLMRTRINTAP